MRILIVEDEYSLADAISETLQREKFFVKICSNGEKGEDEALTGIYDLILLDVMLPGKDGFSILKTLREEKNETPVIMLTAKSEIYDKLNGLENGADDYITKPFHMKELELLENLIINHKQIINKENLANKIWGYNDESEYNNVEVYISFLRRKLRLLKSKVTIKAVRGLGYKLEMEEEK